MAVLAAEWGWTETDVNECLWPHVYEYHRLAIEAKGRRLADELMVARGRGEQFENFLDALERMIGLKAAAQAEDPRLVEARRIEGWLAAKRAMGQVPSESERLAVGRARYLRACVEMGLKHA